MRQSLSRKRGVVLIQVVLLLVVIIGFVALTTDYGLMVVKQRHLQNATDAAALAAGPNLLKSDGTAVTFATDYAEFNGVVNPAVTMGSTGLANSRLTVTATENVATPFAGVLNSAWANRDVHATSVVKAIEYVEASEIRPLAFMVGTFDANKIDQYRDILMHIHVQLKDNGKDYTDTSKDTTDNQPNFFPIDPRYVTNPENILENYGDYKFALKHGMSKYQFWKRQGNTDNSSVIMFDDKNWAENLRLWQEATYEAIVTDSDSILNQAKAKGYENRPYSDLISDDPRAVVLLVNNRARGSELTGLHGYTGFFIQGMTYDSVAHTATIDGYFINPLKRTHTLDSNVPAGVNYGVYSYQLEYQPYL